MGMFIFPRAVYAAAKKCDKTVNMIRNSFVCHINCLRSTDSGGVQRGSPLWRSFLKGHSLANDQGYISFLRRKERSIINAGGTVPHTVGRSQMLSSKNISTVSPIREDAAVRRNTHRHAIMRR